MAVFLKVAMQSSLPSSAYNNRPSRRSRLTALLLSLGIVALIVLTLIAMGRVDLLPGGLGERLTSVQFSRESKAKSDKTKSAAPKEKPRVTVQLPQPVSVPTPVPKVPPIKIINISKTDMAMGDISRLPKSNSAASGGAGGSGSSAATYGPGEGPGGAKLYNAEWYREPSDAQISGYLKRNIPPGAWAMIACKTIEKYHVENCQPLGESPPGSGLAHALRQASWQFLVRPPRIDGKPLIGSWVRIRFDFTKAPKREEVVVAEEEQ